MLILAFLVTDPNWKLFKYLSTGEWKNNCAPAIQWASTQQPKGINYSYSHTDES